MTGMTQQISKSARARAGATPEFVELCKALYGDAVDPHEVWDDVLKASPDQADVHAQRSARIRRNFERGSNAVGLTAATMATGAALRDDRFKEGGKVAQALYRTGKKIPAPISRIGGRKGALLAGGALATQGVNMVGDVAIGQTLGQKKEKVGKSSLRLQPTGVVAKSIVPSKLPRLDKVTEGMRGAWRTMQGGPKAAGAAGRPVLGPPTAGQAKARAVGADAATAISTNTGKVMAGTLAATGAVKANGAAKRRSQGIEYAPDTYGKADDGTVDVEFGGEFSKFDDEKRQVFGWASVVKVNGAPVVDRQGDYIDQEDLEAAAYKYVHGSRVGGDMHKRAGDSAHKVSDMIESMVFTPDKIEKMGLPADFPVGWWVGYQIHDEPTWDLVKKRGRTGFSIHGKGLRKAQDLDQLMGYTQ